MQVLQPGSQPAQRHDGPQTLGRFHRHGTGFHIVDVHSVSLG